MSPQCENSLQWWCYGTAAHTTVVRDVSPKLHLSRLTQGLWMHRWLLTQTQNRTATSQEITHRSFFAWFSILAKALKDGPLLEIPPNRMLEERGGRVQKRRKDRLSMCTRKADFGKSEASKQWRTGKKKSSWVLLPLTVKTSFSLKNLHRKKKKNHAHLPLHSNSLSVTTPPYILSLCNAQGRWSTREA